MTSDALALAATRAPIDTVSPNGLPMPEFAFTRAGSRADLDPEISDSSTDLPRRNWIARAGPSNVA